MQVGLYLHRPLDKDDARRAVSEDPGSLYRPTSFLLIVPTCHIFTAHNHNLLRGCDYKRVVQDTGMFQHIAKFYNSQVDRYSYGRRLLGLSFTASSED